MGVIECPHCGRKVLPKADLCPTCGQDTTDLTHADENRQRRVYSDVMSQLVEDGKSKAVIRDFMLREVGAPQEIVDELLAELDPFLKSTVGERGPRDIVVGSLWLIGGTAVTVGTFLAAEPTGGTFLLAWGPMLFGAVLFAVGVLRFVHSRRRLRLSPREKPGR